MPINPQIVAGFATRLSAFYAAFFVTIGIQLPFLPLWLEAKGLDARTIGIVLAAPMVVRIAAIPIAARAADRRDALRAGIIVGSAATALGYVAVGLSDGALMILLAYALASVAMTPILPLADAYALKGLASSGRSYGQVRLWGSAAFILGSLGAGFMLDLVPPIQLIWFMAASAAVSVAFAVALASPKAPDASAPRAPMPPVRGLLRNRAFLAVAAAASLIQASHALYYGFSALHWRAAGYEGGSVGALWAIGVVAEIILFALSGRLPAAVTPTLLLLIGAAGGILRWSAMAFDPPAAVLPVLQCMHALSFGATHLGAVAFIGRAAPAGLGATAQGYFAIAAGTGMAAATGLSGVLYAAFGATAYAAMAASAGLGGVFALIAHRAARNL
jgi:PPP family 3-phenylpropionic acid transporter